MENSKLFELLFKKHVEFERSIKKQNSQQWFHKYGF